MGELTIDVAEELREELIREAPRPVPESFIPHSKGVEKVSYRAARALRDKGIDVNVERVRISASLHDIGYHVATPEEIEKDPELAFEDFYAYNYLRKIGYPKIADIILSNWTSKELKILRPDMFPEIKLEQLERNTYEKKSLTYGDIHVDAYGNKVSLNYRMAEYKERHKLDPLLIRSLDIGGETRFRNLNNEINELMGYSTFKDFMEKEILMIHRE